MLSVPAELVCVVIVSVSDVELTIQREDIVMVEIACNSSIDCPPDEHRNCSIIVLFNQPDRMCFKVILKVLFGRLTSK